MGVFGSTALLFKVWHGVAVLLLQALSSLQSSGSSQLLRANGKGRSESITNQRRNLLPKHGGVMSTTRGDQDGRTTRDVCWPETRDTLNK